MKAFLIAAAMATGALAGTAALAAGSAQAGATKSAICQACHGANGISINPDWPNLAGLGADYIVQQLTNFKEGKRTNPVMAPNALALSHEDMEDLAAYFNSQPSPNLEGDPALKAAGERLYRGGNAANGTPACQACHGATGLGMEAAKFPALHGQQGVYVARQLHEYASGARTTGPNGIMQTIAKRLSESEISAVAAYVQGLR